MPSHLDSQNTRQRQRGRRRGSPRSLVLPWLLCLVALPYALAADCIRFADYDSINQMFIDGGPGTKVLLCPRKTYRLSGTVVFTAADQELATYGYPTGAERAVLRVESPSIATAVQGDCRRCARVGVRSVVIDGSRGKLGRVADVDAATGLVVLGGSEGQSVRDSWITDPRGFTAIHIREGDKLGCKGAVVERNEIGPAGEEYDAAVDGPDPELSPLGRPLADGISIACRDSVVRGNTLWDNTDAGIVIYCSPGTTVADNTISARKSSAMAGILMVDQTPFDGDYSGLVVKGNTIDAKSRTIRVGVGIGAAVWSDDTETILSGGSVLSNALKGQYMGFGIAAAGLDKWKIKDNWSEARHQGKRSARCFDDPINPDPTAFLYHAMSVDNSELQANFEDHEFAYIACIDGMEDRDSAPPATTETTSAAEPTATTPSTGSEMMDDILLHSQQRMLEAIEGLGMTIDRAHLAPATVDGVDASAAMERMRTRIDQLEREQSELVDLAKALQGAIETFVAERSEFERWQTGVLRLIEKALANDYALPELGDVDARAVDALDDDAGLARQNKYRRGPAPKVLAAQYAEAAARVRRAREEEAALHAWVSPAVWHMAKWAAAAGSVGGLYAAYRRYVGTRRSKIL
ncbi:hypothetical protein Q5752_005130 [Cryptotrichosporon argae]